MCVCVCVCSSSCVVYLFMTVSYPESGCSNVQDRPLQVVNVSPEFGVERGVMCVSECVICAGVYVCVYEGMYVVCMCISV